MKLPLRTKMSKRENGGHSMGEDTRVRSQSGTEGFHTCIQFICNQTTRRPSLRCAGFTPHHLQQTPPSKHILFLNNNEGCQATPVSATCWETIRAAGGGCRGEASSDPTAGALKSSEMCRLLGGGLQGESPHVWSQQEQLVETRECLQATRRRRRGVTSECSSG